ncbi:hypothetical protein J31TS6_41780 [Brevibacillus reuszeri]|uniref:hypothetical protein n=1 Tax=Brevibacillus reuszeri TaxID=54915 RepID=UPI001B0BF46B|nr:hypothetical protein [Brevibacillus reuszeri]GIO08150.1 hypothetical protein J31TS6_41780 [Brevibacillus reuszeri]
MNCSLLWWEENGENDSDSWNTSMEGLTVRLREKSETASKVDGSGGFSEVDA